MKRDIMEQMVELSGIPVPASEAGDDLVEAKRISKADMKKAVNQAYYKYFDRVSVDVFDITKIYREFERAIAAGDDLDKVGNTLVTKFRAPEFKREDDEGQVLESPKGQWMDPDQERMFDEIVLMAVNDGKFYPKRAAKGAVKQAFAEYQKDKIRAMSEDFRTIERKAVMEVLAQWDA